MNGTREFQKQPFQAYPNMLAFQLLHKYDCVCENSFLKMYECCDKAESMLAKIKPFSKRLQKLRRTSGEKADRIVKRLAWLRFVVFLVLLYPLTIMNISPCLMNFIGIVLAMIVMGGVYKDLCPRYIWQRHEVYQKELDAEYEKNAQTGKASFSDDGLEVNKVLEVFGRD